MTPAMRPRTQRKVQRLVHLAGASLLFAYVYAPMGPHLEGFVRFLAFPLLVLTGIAMWQAARIRRAWKRFAAPRTREARRAS